MTFKKYPKVHRLGKEETDGILEGTCTIQEKVDGANTSIWLDKRGDIVCGSRNRELTEGFNGFVEYVKEHEGIKHFFEDNPTQRLYGEWLVRHTIQYNEMAYKQFYLFDVTEVGDGEETEVFFQQEEVQKIAEEYELNYPQIFEVIENPTPEQIKEYVGKTELGEMGEGVVIKNMDHVDKFGNHCYAKIVTDKFMESNSITFGGNNKHSDTYWEMYVVNKYMTLPRIEKIMNKLQPLIDKRLDYEHIPRITNTAYHDLLTEEIWEIAKKVHALDFKKLKNLCNKKAIQIYKDKLNGDISIADKEICVECGSDEDVQQKQCVDCRVTA